MLRRLGQLTIVLLIFFSLLIKSTDEKKILKLTNFICKAYNKTFGDFVYCRIRALKRDVSSISVLYNLKTVIEDHLMVNMHIDKRGTNTRNPTLYNVTFDACLFFKDRQKFPMANLIFKITGLEDHSNMNHSCPYQGELFLNDYRLDEKYVSLLPVPYGGYSLTGNYIYRSKLVASFEAPFQFYETEMTRNFTMYRPF